MSSTTCSMSSESLRSRKKKRGDAVEIMRTGLYKGIYHKGLPRMCGAAGEKTMSNQMNLADFMGEKFISAKDIEKAEQEAKKRIEARNRASSIIEDAKNRYIKEKTRARSKKAAAERDAILSSDRFKALDEYDRLEDINEAYGWDAITEAQRDKLEDLWNERENIRNHTEDGFYKDLVTEALGEAWIYLQDLWEDEVEKAKIMRDKFENARKADS